MFRKIIDSGLIIGLICIFSGSPLESTVYGYPKKPFDVRKFLKDNEIPSLGHYANWLKENLSYSRDPKKDNWQTPQETLDKGSGDCEDLAFLSAEVLRAFGMKPYVLASGKGKNAHVYTVFKYKGVYYAFDNIKLANTHMKNIKDMAMYLGEKEKAEYLLELTLEPKNVRVIFYIDHSKDKLTLRVPVPNNFPQG